MRALFTLFLICLQAAAIFAQSPGEIFRPASPITNALDPNGDGYASASGAAYSGSEDFEYPFIPIPQVNPEPDSDLRSGGGCGPTDIVDNPGTGADASYVYYTSYGGQDIMIYRMRIATNTSGAFGFSVLVDTDGLMGDTGPSADPNFIGPQGGKKPGNPGFEFEIQYVSGGGSNGIVVYNVDGALSGTEVSRYTLASNSQKSYALYNDGDCGTANSVFYDFFIPISDMGLTESSMIRLAAATSINPGTVFNGASDIAGVDDTLFPIPDDAFIDLIEAQNPTPIGNLDEDGCFITNQSDLPTVNGPLFDSQTSISGTSTEADGAEIKLYINNNLYATEILSGGTFTFTFPRNTLIPYDRIQITAQDPCEYESVEVELFVIDDLDSDGDGIPDTDEGFGEDPGSDADGDRIPNFRDSSYPGFTDSNGDGVNDAFDSDLDGVPNHYDLDSDNDGLTDIYEAGGETLDANDDGILDALSDTDNDGLADGVDGSPLANPDTDGDGLTDPFDLDSDGDGLPDYHEAGGTDSNADGQIDGFTDANADGLADTRPALSYADTDADGLPDYRDIDSDADGIPDLREVQAYTGYLTPSGSDSDADGIDDTFDTDSGFVGFSFPNTDGTGNADYLDTDADGDGVSDLIEANDANFDGFADLSPSGTDSDNDGLDDAFDTAGSGTNNALGSNVALPDLDGNGVPNWRDTDDDGDSLLTASEGNGFAEGGNPRPDYLYNADFDGDGIVDINDLDSDNDGVPDAEEGSVSGLSPFADTDGDGKMNYLDTDAAGSDTNGDGIVDAFDADFDGLPNFQDLDSDGDGIADLVEAGYTDTDGNGLVDTFVDGDANGMSDAFEGTSVADTDGDGIKNHLDVDSDGDGILDNTEAFASAAYTAPAGADANRNGLDDAYEGGTAISPINTDGDSAADYLDTDSDDDSIGDAIEGFDANQDGTADYSPAGTDSDNDGLDDAYDTLSGAGSAMASNASLQDTDSDGTADWQDVDDDGDGRLTDNEGTGYAEGGFPRPDYLYGGDYDGDGVSDVNDADSDNDGIADANEDGGTGFDPTADADGDGVLNMFDDSDATASFPAFTDANGDGINDVYDSDLDGLPDFRDLDSDNDGIYDLTEVNGSGTNGQLNGPYDANGLATSLSGTSLPLIDSDSDGVADAFDIDADNDGISDLLENGQADADKDGRADNFTDANGNGVHDAYDEANGGSQYTLLDTDGDGQDNFRDLDADGDGLYDLVEAGGADTDDNGQIDTTADANANGLADAYDVEASNTALALADTDGDGIANFLDLDSDNDNLADAIERLNHAGSPTASGFDTDGDGLQDYLDTDSDNDGIADAIEGDDANQDGTADTAGSGDANGNGWDDSFEFDKALPDTDSDGRPDFRDNDDDADGIPTIDEPLDLNPADGIPDYLSDDVGNCGVGFITEEVNGNASAINTNAGVTNASATLGSGDNDYADFDNNNDRLILDLGEELYSESQIINVLIRLGVTKNGKSTMLMVESGLSNSAFANPAMYSTSNFAGYDVVNYPIAVGTRVRFLELERIYNNAGVKVDAISYQFDRCLPDNDNDGIADLIDNDDDNDGIPDLTETGGIDPSADSDGDYIPDYMDADFAGFVDVNGDGVNDNFDLDLDGVANHLDLDSDNDGITDAVEANGGVLPSNMTSAGKYPVAYVYNYDSDGDGLANDVDPDASGTALVRPDSDGDGLVDMWDLDSDGDGFFDYSEGFDDNGSGDALDDLVQRAANWEAATGLGYYTAANSDADQFPNWLEDDNADNYLNFLDYNSPFFQDSDGDGLVDLFDPDAFGLAASIPDNDGDGLQDYRQMAVQIPLPVVLRRFYAETLKGGLMLHWEVEQEVAFSHYILEHSIDGEAFKAIARIEAVGSLEPYTYQQADYSPQKGVNYYRLRMVDLDGSEELSKPIYAWYTGATSLRLFPNPWQQGQPLHLRGIHAEAVKAIRILTMAGGQSGLLSYNASADGLRLQLPDLASGLYLLEVETTSGKQQLRLMIQ